jgi:hypothetical protein
MRARRNANGFIAGPVVLADGTVAVNDRIAAITPADLMPRVMQRVAQEVLHCVRSAGPAGSRHLRIDDGHAPAPASAASRRRSHAPARSHPTKARRGGNAWRRHVFYALDVQARGCRGPAGRFTAARGRPRGRARPSQASPTEADADSDVRQWLEGPHRELERLNPASPEPRCAGVPSAPCAPGPCDRVVVAPADSHRNDAVVAP